MARAGNVARTTNVISHPVTKAKTNPAMSIAKVITNIDIFSPSAFWKEKVSAANFEESYD